jgi:release factor glutamine methyltransferase
MNIQNTINKASNILKENNIISFQLDSEILLANILKKDRKYIIINPQVVLSDVQLKNFKNLIEQRSKGKPIAYLVNKKNFWNYEFIVAKNVLIPRPDTELVIREILEITKNKKKLNILDIGVGSGCILLTLLGEKKDLRGVGIDISKKCIDISRINAKKLGVEQRVKFFKSDIDKFNIGKYDVIVSNPPYIKKHLIKYLEKDVAKFEPKLALDGGVDGTSKIKKVIDKTSILIKKNGKFVLEIAFDQKKIVMDLLIKKGFFINKVIKDYAGKDRCIICTKID